MSSIAGAIQLQGAPIPDLEKRLRVMNELQKHRGGDGSGVWAHPKGRAGFAYNHLRVLEDGAEPRPLSDEGGNCICLSGVLYNYETLRAQLGGDFRTGSDAELILRAYREWGEECAARLDGTFSFLIWDETEQKLFGARDRFGIHPLCYTEVDGVFYFASEHKALLPFLPSIETNPEGLQDYFTFQVCLGGKTLFKGIREALPAHTFTVKDGRFREKRYWQVYYNIDLDHTEKWFFEKLDERLQASVKKHLRADVPVGSYVSGGVDSSIVASMARDRLDNFAGFTGKFSFSQDYDESRYARILAERKDFPLYELDITSQDFLDNMEKVIYHLDCPAGGPGSFSQYMIGGYATKHRKVMLGGQGGDEIFGGYTRYLVAYFEQCIKGAIDGTNQNANYIVTYESIIPNLVSLRNYKPMLKELWSHGLFDDPDKRYFQLLNRAPQMGECVRWDALPRDYSAYETFREVFLSENVAGGSYFDSMTHFDFKALLPALLQVDDRMSMAHGLESRVPFLDRDLVELAATMPAIAKFKGGTMKYALRETFRKYVPAEIMDRKDKMGFPTPFNHWAKNDAHDFLLDVFSSQKALGRAYIDNRRVLEKLEGESKFSRNIWGLFCLELWQRQFHDRADYFRGLLA